MIRPPPKSPLFPYPTLSQSLDPQVGLDPPDEIVRPDGDPARGDDHVRAKRQLERLPMGLLVVADRRRALDERSRARQLGREEDRKSTRLNSSHLVISYAVFC